MGTAGQQVPAPIVSPQPEDNQVDAVGARSSEQLAQSILQYHMAGLYARRERDLLSEKLLLHVDGGGDFQWAEILYGQRVVIPRVISEFRKTDNLLRLVVDNAVAHHTTMPLHFFADSPVDRQARDRAIMDSLLINHIAHQQDWNNLFAEALYMAMPAGFCPVHAYWRDGVIDSSEPINTASGTDATAGIGPGMLDCWVGNPFDSVFDRGARRGSANWMSYGRILPAQLIRDAFSHVPAAASLEGTTRTPSAAEFQRIAAAWRAEGMGMHGYPVMTQRRAHSGNEGEELMVIVCREVLPGYEKDYPEGRLQIIAVPGSTDLRWRDARERGVLLADQPLPGGDFSWALVYSHHRQDDIHGKPWVEDIDQLQVDYNIARSKRWELANKMAEAPIVAPGGAIADDMADIGPYNILEIEPSLGTWRPQVMEWPTSALQAIDREIEDIRSSIFTAGGYQAASRGEAPGSRIAYRALVALQQADNTIHGPVNMRFRRSACDFARRCWKQFKMYGSTPWLIDVVGDEYSYLAEPYIDNTKISHRAPNYKLVNAFGASPEIRAQEVLELMQTTGADGVPFLTTEEARRQYPNPMIFDTAGNPATVQRRRARTVAAAFVRLALQFRQQTQLQEAAISHPQVQQAAMMVFQRIEVEYPRLRDDDLNAHIATLTEITQDETIDPLARLAAMQRQNLYYEWQAMMAQQVMYAPDQGGGNGASGPGATDVLNQRGIAAEMGGSGKPVVEHDANTTTAPSSTATAR